MPDTTVETTLLAINQHFENVKFNSRFVVVVDDCPVSSFDSWQLKYFDGRFGLEASVRAACFKVSKINIQNCIFK